MSEHVRHWGISACIALIGPVLLLSGCTSLIVAGAGPKAGCESDIHSAVQLGDIKEVARLLDHGRDPNSRACGFPPPIFNALEEKKMDVIRYLAKRGAQIDARELSEKRATQERYMHNFTPLMRACAQAGYSPHGLRVESKGHKVVMNLLIDLGADVNAIDGSRAIPEICWDRESLSVLAARGANLNHDADYLYIQAIGYSIADGEAAWRLGVRPDLNKVAMHFLRYHIGVPEKSQGGSSQAPGWGVPIADILDELKKHGFTPSAAQRNGHRPVHMAVFQSGTGILQWLLANGADPNERNARGETPLGVLAGSRMSPELMKVRTEMLRAYGAS